MCDVCVCDVWVWWWIWKKLSCTYWLLVLQFPDVHMSGYLPLWRIWHTHTQRNWQDLAQKQEMSFVRKKKNKKKQKTTQPPLNRGTAAMPLVSDTAIICKSAIMHKSLWSFDVKTIHTTHTYTHTSTLAEHSSTHARKRTRTRTQMKKNKMMNTYSGTNLSRASSSVAW